MAFCGCSTAEPSSGLNIRVDCRLLHKRFPAAVLAELIDTMCVVRTLHPERKKATASARGSNDSTSPTPSTTLPRQPATPRLRDTIAAAFLLGAFVRSAEPGDQAVGHLRAIAGVPLGDGRPPYADVRTTIANPP